MEMKEYMTPEMEVVKIEYQSPLLEASSGIANPDETEESPGGDF